MVSSKGTLRPSLVDQHGTTDLPLDAPDVSGLMRQSSVFSVRAGRRSTSRSTTLVKMIEPQRLKTLTTIRTKRKRPHAPHCVPYGLTTTADTSTRRRDDGDFAETLPRTLNYMLLLRNERILFTNAGHKSVLRTPKHVCACMAERPRGERP